MSVLVETTLGALVLDLFVEDCPLACTNFLKLCKTKYYHGCLFFNVQENFMVQAGDPTATGTGGDSIYGKLYGAQARFFEDELPKSKGRSHEDRRGLLGMASGSVNQNASQFYITTRAEDMAYLDGQHTIFGEVAEGMDVLDKINALFVDKDYRPYQDVRIKHTYVLDDPFPDPKGLDELIPPSSPTRERPEEEQVEPRLAADEKLDENEGRTEQEIEKAVREKEAKSRAVVLEMIGDLPDADVKPPEEVLFVCKLNPVTESADLDMAFCRFGPCKSEVIRDQKTGDSLCFAFVEFTDRRHCEEAYFKMNNVLLDDRRIKVDFSQSVSKLWNKVKRRPWEKPTKRDGDAYAKDRKSGGRDSRNGGGGRRELGGNLRLKSRGSDDFKLVEEEEAASSSRRSKPAPDRDERRRSRSRDRGQSSRSERDPSRSKRRSHSRERRNDRRRDRHERRRQSRSRERDRRIRSRSPSSSRRSDRGRYHPRSR
ncbi:Peptidyl-prolyl cis-trans isomerase [Phytophthora cactorum]|uniref:Peptidyl-prolyl cis-trans isomerase n=1 Tax=Phytophthora cactorum TaxID=29920 RepID=A0A329RTS3_9STRA|nr:Peptidyl-prolyl cis-trans isomerase [Phytophthora cactorum]KAG2811033.1 Peptidyl-prolyl cis-trans isomerase [Phytophthora cactorum]KAG2850151.1 Peptidyl-prolyl cis-trans isomerase [Phytophthora cactorum]KAG2890090.1 Peptidyl-prolyl cis-trans isomerase [Phytophthora cactorum]KAG2902609.1 Peptidyl-prolyl cis-trans isomerase [Phytophthora cactorum]